MCLETDHCGKLIINKIFFYKKYILIIKGWCGNRCIPGVKALKACVNSPDFCPKDTWITAPKDCATPKMHVNN